MAKNLLLGVLLDKLGEYVDADSLASENLRLGVFAGKLELSNLRLNRHALRTAAGAASPRPSHSSPPTRRPGGHREGPDPKHQSGDTVGISWKLSGEGSRGWAVHTDRCDRC